MSVIQAFQLIGGLAASATIIGGGFVFVDDAYESHDVAAEAYDIASEVAEARQADEDVIRLLCELKKVGGEEESETCMRQRLKDEARRDSEGEE